jgi:RHS repeat-associated protein
LTPYTLMQGGQVQFTWNAAGRLKKIINGNKIRKYKYNGFGERVRRDGKEKRRFTFFHDPAGRLISQFSANNIAKENWKLQQETVWFNDIPVAVINQASPTDPVQVFMIHADHLNTPRVITDSTGTPVWLWQNQNAFGDNPPNEDPDGDGIKFNYNLRFAGQYFDAETNLHYNYFRDYEPQSGRYLSSDPIGLAGGLNTYGYALQNPVSFNDPTGEYVPPLLLWAFGGALTLLDMMAPIKPHPVYPDAIESVVTLPGPLGKIGSARKSCETAKGVRYGPTNPGPLDDAAAATFRSGSYTVTTVSKTTTLHRVYGGSAGKLGHYWTRTKPSGPLQSQLDSALAPQWGNTAQHVVNIRVPKGTTIFEGAAAPQSTGVGQILGGGNLVYIPRVDPKWIQ